MITETEKKIILRSNATMYHIPLPLRLDSSNSKAAHGTLADTPASSRSTRGDYNLSPSPTTTSFVHGLPTPTSSKPPTSLFPINLPYAEEQDYLSASCDNGDHIKSRTPSPQEGQYVPSSVPSVVGPERVNAAPAGYRTLRGRRDRSKTSPAYFGGRKPEKSRTFCSWSQQDQKRGFHLRLFEHHCTPEDDMGYGYTSTSE